jgi:DNA-binding LacI/PurR family transcriptional regulator
LPCVLALSVPRPEGRPGHGAFRRVWGCLWSRGLRVPDDVSVTGVDDIALATALDPELTTLRLDAERFGEHGMHALLAVLEGRTPEQGDIPVELVVRGSTGTPRPS